MSNSILNSISNHVQPSQLLTASKLQELLQSMYQNHVQYEIACFRQELEDTHFVCATFMLEQLINQYDKSSNHEQSNGELKNFISTLIKYKYSYLNQHLREELTMLEKNCSNFEHLRKLAQFYKYWSISASQKVYEKIECIKLELCRENPIFYQLQEKIKIEPQHKIKSAVLRFGIMAGQFQRLSPKTPQTSQSIDRFRYLRDSSIIDNQFKGLPYLQDTMINDEYLRILAQIERVHKGFFEGSVNSEEIQSNQINELFKSRRTYIQIAEFLKSLIIKQTKTIEEKKKRPDGMDEEQYDESIHTGKIRGSYWDIVEYKLSHDQLLIECLMNEAYSIDKSLKPTLMCATLLDNSNQICCVELGKFGNIIAVGLFDGTIVIYELTERFLLPGIQVEQEQAKNKITIVNIINNFKHNSFVLNQHSGPITALSLLYDELYILSTSIDLSIKLWCLRSRQPLVSFKGHLQQIWCMTWAPAGYWFATGSADQTAMLWATDHIHCQRVFDPSAGVVALAFTPSVLHLLTGDENLTLRVWSIESGECLQITPLDSQPTTLSMNHCGNQIGISLTGQFLIVGMNDGQVNLYFLPSMRELKSKIFLERPHFIDQSQESSSDTKHSEGKTQRRQPIRFSDFSFDESMVCCGTSSRIAFFSINELVRQPKEDAFLGVYNSEQLLRLQANDSPILKNCEPLTMLDNQSFNNILTTKFIPSGYAIQIVR